MMDTTQHKDLHATDSHAQHQPLPEHNNLAPPMVRNNYKHRKIGERGGEREERGRERKSVVYVSAHNVFYQAPCWLADNSESPHAETA